MAMVEERVVHEGCWRHPHPFIDESCFVEVVPRAVFVGELQHQRDQLAHRNARPAGLRADLQPEAHRIAGELVRVERLEGARVVLGRLREPRSRW